MCLIYNKDIYNKDIYSKDIFARFFSEHHVGILIRNYQYTILIKH